jgi:hypothetical protein
MGGDGRHPNALRDDRDPFLFSLASFNKEEGEYGSRSVDG